MSFKTASALLRGKWLIEPAYAKAQLPLVLQMLKGDVNHTTRKQRDTESNVPTRKTFAGLQNSLVGCSPYTSMDRIPYNSIVVVDIIGPVLKYGDWCTYGTVEYNDLFIRLANSDRVSGIICNMDTPGGQAAGTATLAQTIKDVSKIKPAICICQDGIIASAGMWLASAFQEIYVTQNTDMIGSIGAYTTIYDFTKYFEDAGIILHDIYAPQSTEKNLDYKQALEGNYNLIEEELKYLVQEFIKTVKTNRGARLNLSVADPFKGKMFFAQDAIQVGLIDGIKPMAGVVKRMEQLISLRA